MLAGGVVFATVTMLSVQSAVGSGIARRDAVRVEQQYQQEAMKFAQDAVARGRQGHTEALTTSAEAALQHALKAGRGPHVEAAITELKHAIEHGKAGHPDMATAHAEHAVTHLSEK